MLFSQHATTVSIHTLLVTAHPRASRKASYGLYPPPYPLHTQIIWIISFSFLKSFWKGIHQFWSKASITEVFFHLPNRTSSRQRVRRSKNILSSIISNWPYHLGLLKPNWQDVMNNTMTSVSFFSFYIIHLCFHSPQNVQREATALNFGEIWITLEENVLSLNWITFTEGPSHFKTHSVRLFSLFSI